MQGADYKVVIQGIYPMSKLTSDQTVLFTDLTVDQVTAALADAGVVPIDKPIATYSTAYKTDVTVATDDIDKLSGVEIMLPGYGVLD